MSDVQAPAQTEGSARARRVTDGGRKIDLIYHGVDLPGFAPHPQLDSA